MRVVGILIKFQGVSNSFKSKLHHRTSGIRSMMFHPTTFSEQRCYLIRSAYIPLIKKKQPNIIKWKKPYFKRRKIYLPGYIEQNSVELFRKRFWIVG